MVNWQFPTSPYWSLLVVGGIIYCWAATMISIKKGYNSGMNIWIQMLVSSVFVLLVDLLLGFHRWSLSIAIPTICIVGNIAMIIMMIIRHFDLKDFIIYILASCLYGMIPLIFFLLNWVDIKWICLSSAALFTREYIAEHEAEFDQVYDLLADETSKKTYLDILNFKVSGKIEYLYQCRSEKPEVYTNLLKPNDQEIFVDLGAYDGDTIAEFLQFVSDYQHIYALEPDAKNFKKLGY